ncbi:hypothetical protein KAX02_08715 [candidate division WOR-3 bacterium]|nr:hypothetical protein [candidate division WOR-3 bacterium]
MTETDTILGLTHEEFKETMLSAAIMAGVGFGITFVGLIVRHYVQEKIT